MAGKKYSVIEIAELFEKAAAIEDVEEKKAEFLRIAGLSVLKADEAAVTEKVAAMFSEAGFELPAAEPEAVEMVKLVAKTSFGGPLGSFAPGDPIEVPADIAASWVEHGLAEKA